MRIPTSLGVAAAGAGLCFIGYCIYFDRKRRSDPNFKQKLRESKQKRSYICWVSYVTLIRNGTLLYKVGLNGRP